MAQFSYGPVTIELPEKCIPPENAGNLSTKEVQRIPKAPHGVGLVCEIAATAGEHAGAKFTWPQGVTPQTLRDASEKADGMDVVIAGLQAALAVVQQANLMFDAEAWEQLRMLNDQIKAQGKYQPELLNTFRPVLDFFAKGSR